MAKAKKTQATRQRAGRPPAGETLPAVDKDRIRRLQEREVAQVHRKFERFLSEDADRATLKEGLKAAARMVNAAEKAKRELNEAALSLAVHENRRVVWKAAGMLRSWFYRLRMREEAKGNIPYVPDAAEKLPGLVEKAAKAEARSHAAIPIRDQIANRLFEAGYMERAEIAEITGRTWGNVWLRVGKSA